MLFCVTKPILSYFPRYPSIVVMVSKSWIFTFKGRRRQRSQFCLKILIEILVMETVCPVNAP